MRLSMVCLLRMEFKTGILCNAVFVYTIANNSYLITKIFLKKKLIDIVCFINFKNGNTSTMLYKFYKSFLQPY